MAPLDASTIISTFLGGLVSGLVGVGLFLIRSRSEEFEGLEAWYTRCIQFSRQIQSAGREEASLGAHQHVLEVGERAKRSILDHFSRAPDGVEVEVLEDLDNLTEAIGEYSSAFGLDEDAREESIRNLMEKAESLEDSAIEARNDVGGPIRRIRRSHRTD